MTVRILLVTDAGDVRRWHRSIDEELRTVAAVRTVGLRMETVPTERRPDPWAALPARALPRAVPDLRAAARPSWPALSPSDLADFGPASTDLVIDLTAGRRATPPPGVPVWSLVTMDGRAFPRGFPFLEEAYRAGSVATIVLAERRGPGEADGIVDSITLSPTRRSYAAFLREALGLSRSMLTARSAGRPAPAAFPRRAPPAPAEGRREPGAAALLRFLGRGLVDHVWHQHKDKLLMEEWRIGYLDRPIGSTLAQTGMADARWLDVGRLGGYAADPFGLPGADDRLYCEVYSWATGRGVIREMAVSGDSGALGALQDFGCDAHMSYPCLFEEGGELYCVPEQLETRAVTLFRHDRAAGRWRRFATPLTGTRAADPAFFVFGGRYWIAYTDVDIDGYNNLCLLHAESLAGPWRRHDRFPVKIDVRSARSAGTPFWHDGALYRPAQDCSLTYGGAIALNRIRVCTPDAYEEEVAAVLRPDPAGPARHGLHTLSRWGGRTLIDGKQYAFSLPVLGRKVMRKLSGRLARPVPAVAGKGSGPGVGGAGEGPAPQAFSERGGA
ncbi:hypothetical protein J2847_001040 [Azospirillum agricola]|uniref:glucosamine inositolphosphorylceramide transferase family protein n=1 Tax=Azospirillum agricola TaxID=1720247 RepID=UPI001AE842D0|nr:hypothetical protein [Azospirillum agricola]MBP2227758.1 hypothetical protein [Azospirillum agricola]